MNFLRMVGDSIFGPEFYAKVPKRSMGSVIGYFMVLALALIFVQAIKPAGQFWLTGRHEIKKFVDEAVRLYPSELEVVIKDSKVRTNVEEPYFIGMPKSEKSDEKRPAHLVVIDTVTPFSAEQFNEYDAMVWVGKDAIFTQGDNQMRTYDLSKVDDVTINKALVNSLVKKFAPLVWVLVPIVGFLVLIVLYLIYAMRLVYGLFLAGLIWVLSRMIKKTFSYSDAYKVGVHAMTLALLMNIVFGWVNFPRFPFMFTLISVVVYLVNFLYVPRDTKNRH